MAVIFIGYDIVDLCLPWAAMYLLGLTYPCIQSKQMIAQLIRVLVTFIALTSM